MLDTLDVPLKCSNCYLGEKKEEESMEAALSYYTAMRWNKPLLLCSKSLHHYSPCACILHPFIYSIFYEEAQSIQQIKTAKYFSLLLAQTYQLSLKGCKQRETPCLPSDKTH